MRAFALFGVGVLSLALATVIFGYVYDESRRQAFITCLLQQPSYLTPQQKARNCAQEVYP